MLDIPKLKNYEHWTSRDIEEELNQPVDLHKMEIKILSFDLISWWIVLYLCKYEHGELGSIGIWTGPIHCTGLSDSWCSNGHTPFYDGLVSTLMTFSEPVLS